MGSNPVVTKMLNFKKEKEKRVGKHIKKVSRKDIEMVRSIDASVVKGLIKDFHIRTGMGIKYLQEDCVLGALPLRPSSLN